MEKLNQPESNELLLQRFTDESINNLFFTLLEYLSHIGGNTDDYYANFALFVGEANAMRKELLATSDLFKRLEIYKKHIVGNKEASRFYANSENRSHKHTSYLRAGIDNVLNHIFILPKH